MFLFHVRRTLTATAIALGLVGLSSAQLIAQSGLITGKITDAATGQPIQAAQVQAQAGTGQSLGALSDAQGVYRITNAPAGSYTITIRIIGYEMRRISDVQLTSGATVTVNAQLSVASTMLSETVVTASRNKPEKALDAPAQISVISGDKITERPAVTVADYLGGTPGLSINKGGIAQSNIVARGFNNAFSGSMLMLQDYRFAGVPSLRVNVPLMFTGTNEDIDRIEVLLGPASALYGPNSASGVLHVITKSPFTSQGTTISVDGGERSLLRAGLRHAQVFNDKAAFKLSGEYMQGKDWEYNDPSEPVKFGTSASIPEERRGVDNNRNFDLQKFTGEARLDLRPRENMEAITTLGYSRIGDAIELTSANGSAQAHNWTYTSLQQRFRYDRFFAQAFINLSDAGNDTSSSAAGTYLLRSGQPIVDQSRVWALQAQHGFDMGTRQGFTYGVDYIHTDPRTGGTINGANEDNDNVTEWGAYVQSTTRPIEWLELLAAARVDGNNVIAGNFFSPRAAVIFKPKENQNIRLTYNRAFSTPANFSFFLDLIQSPNVGGSGFDVVARGNPPKTGWTFRRDCSSSGFGNYCMKSRFANNGEYTGASAAAAFGGAIVGMGPALTPAVSEGIKGALMQFAGLPEQQAAALAPQLTQGLLAHLASRTPTASELSTRVSYLGTAAALTPGQVTDLKPLGASFNQNYEIGYKGIINDRFRFDVSWWGQDRGDVATTVALSTPNVFFGSATELGTYITSEATTFLSQALVPYAGAAAGALGAGIAAQLGPGLGAGLSPLPLGVVTFDSPNTSPTEVYASYQRLNHKVWVSGIDLAVDLVATDRISLDGSFSWQSKNIWEDILVSGIPFMSNTPTSKGAFGARYRDEPRGFGLEARVRFSDSYPVNSGVYATNTAFVLGSGQPGSTATPPTQTGWDKCSPAAAGTYCYESVPDAYMIDAQISKRFEVGAHPFTISLNATNLLDNRVRTFPGVPEIGRMVMTRLQYSF